MKNEIKSLTGLRGVAAVIVMAYHFCGNDAYLEPFVPSIVKRGYLGVDVFFILSGFVMALSYGALFKSGVASKDYWSFMAKRLARVYPLYAVITFIFVLKYELNLSGVWVGDFHAADLAACLMMIQAWGFGFHSVAGATWSLSTELFAYIVFPLLAWATVFARPIYAVAAAVGSAALLAVIVASGHGVSGSLDVVASDSILPVLRCLAGFSFGLLSYRVALSAPLRGLLSSSAALGGIMICLLLAAYAGAADLAMFALFPALVVILFHEPMLALRTFGSRFVHHLGVVSYSIYLVHPLFVPVKSRLMPLAVERLGEAAHVLVLASVVLATWGLACLFYRWVEVPGRAHFQRIFLRPRAVEVVS